MRLLPKRTPPPPKDLHDRLGVPAKERILAWGRGPEGYVAATDAGLRIEVPSSSSVEILGWDVITKATWEEPILAVTLEAGAGRPARNLRLRVDESGDLPAAIRDRVTASVVVSEVVAIGEGATARMVARRATDDAEIRWSVVFEAGADASDPLLQERARRALEDLRASLGI